MPTRTLVWLIALAMSFAAIAPVSGAARAAQPPEFRTYTAPDARTVRYGLVLPKGFDPIKPAPVVLVLPPGTQDQAMVERAISLYFQDAATERGWVVICPIAPEGSSWQRDGALLAGVLDEVAKSIRPENGLVHLAGISNGGLAAFSLAIEQPGRFASLVVLPGVPGDATWFDRLDRLKNVPVTMFVGENDTEFWLPQARRTAERLAQLGVDHDLTVLPGQGHVLALEPGVIFDALDRRRPGVRAARAAREVSIKAVAGVLDDFHDAAAKADEVRYFDHFAPDAVFLGTDATERWTLSQFRLFALPYFQRDSAWVYTPRVRHVGLSPDGATAWFDETLDNAKYGECRGTGVLVKSGGTWRIAQYNLMKPVPNDAMDGLLKVIDDLKKAPTKPVTPPSTTPATPSPNPPGAPK